MDSPIFPEFHPPSSMANFATMPTSHRARNSGNNHRSTANDFPTMFRYRISSDTTLPPFLESEEAAVVPAPSEGPSTRSRKRKHSETDQNPPPSSIIEGPTLSPPNGGPSAARPSRRRPAAASTKRGRNGSLKKPPPASSTAGAATAASAKVSGDDDEDDVGEKKPAAAIFNCCICMCDVDPPDLAHINGCDHKFCFGCIEKWAERENSCPLCKQRFTKIDRVNKKRKKGTKNTKKVKQRDQRTDLTASVTVQGMVASFGARGRGIPDFFFGGDIARGRFLLRTAGIHAGVPGQPGHFSTETAPPGLLAALGGELDSDTDEDMRNPLSLIRTLRQYGFSAQPHSAHAAAFNIGASPATSTTRSYASNMNDNTAGHGAENPLEIDDSDEEVEVVHVMRP